MKSNTGCVGSYLAGTITVLKATAQLDAGILRAVEAWKAALTLGRKVIFCGNGGSAADAQHLAAALMGRPG